MMRGMRPFSVHPRATVSFKVINNDVLLENED